MQILANGARPAETNIHNRMRHVPTALYIDTEVFVRNGLRLDTRDFVALRETFVQRGLRLLVPEIMERELYRHFRRRANEVADVLAKAHKQYPIESLALLSLPSTQDLERRCFEAFCEQWKKFKEHFTVEVLPLVGRLESVVDWYFGIEAPFSEKKPKEFPDAFILSVLEEYYQKHHSRVAVISCDGDYSKVCSKRDYLRHFEKIRDYIDAFKPELTKLDDGIIDPTRPITTEDLTEMKAILGRGTDVTVIERNRVLNLLSTRGSNYDYFFQNATEAFWIDVLQEGGFFLNPPRAEKFEDGRITMPVWWPIEYLVRVFDKAPEKVVGVLKSIPKTDNVWILEGIVRIVLKSDDSALFQTFYESITVFIDSARRGHEMIIALLTKSYLLHDRLSDIGSALLLKIVEFQPDPMAEEMGQWRAKDPSDWATSLEPLPRFDSWEYQQIVERGVRPLAEHEPFTVARILIDATSSMIRLRMHRDELENGSEEDQSEIWCLRLDRPTRELDDPKEALVQTLVAACKAVYEKAPESIHALDQSLRNQRWNVFKRIRQYLYGLNPSEQTLPWIREILLAHADYGKWDHHYEFQIMVRVACKHFGSRLLTEAERATIFETILRGPSHESFREWMADRYTDGAWRQRQRFFHRKQFRPFASILFGKFRTYFDALEKEFAEDELTDESYSPIGEVRGGTVSYRSPRSLEELQHLSDEELLACINEWEESHRDSDDWLVEVNIRALAETFQKIFKDDIVPNSSRLSFWLDNRERIGRPVYTKAMVEAMQVLTKEKRFDQLGRWLEFCEWILDRPNEALENDERSSDESRENPNWGTCRRAVGDFVDVCLSKDVQVPVTARGALREILRKLCNQFDSGIDHERSVVRDGDQISQAINNTRSRALESLVDFGYWVRRHEEGADVPEVLEILASRFAAGSAHPLTLPEYALLGLHFGRIWNLNNKWAETNKSRIFPQDDLPTWVESFTAFIRFNNPLLSIFEVLRGDFAFALNHLDALDDDGGRGRNVIDTIGQHLFSYYLWDVYPLGGDSSLLSTFYDKTSADRAHWGRLFDHVGRTLRNTTKLDEKLHERILVFFDWRLKQAEAIELQEFTFWLGAACLDPDWRLQAYAKILDMPRAKDVGLSIELDSLNQMLESHTAKVVECFAKITDSFTQDGSIFIQTEKAKPILLAGLRSTDEAIRSNAERARENLLKAGRFDFLAIQ